MIKIAIGILIGSALGAAAQSTTAVSPGVPIHAQAYMPTALDPDGFPRMLKVDAEGNVLARCAR